MITPILKHSPSLTENFVYREEIMNGVIASPTLSGGLPRCQRIGFGVGVDPVREICGQLNRLCTTRPLPVGVGQNGRGWML